MFFLVSSTMAMDKIRFKVRLSFYLLQNDNTEEIDPTFGPNFTKVWAKGLVLAGISSEKRTVCCYILWNLD